MGSNIGVNKKGYIINEIKKNNIVEPWGSLIDEVVKEIHYKFPEEIHSIYLYGSVGKGKAQLNASDLDLTIILTIKITDNTKYMFEEINQQFTSKYSFVREIGFDLGTLRQVNDKNNYYSWGFWIKANCDCIWGKNLADNFPDFKPSKKIANAINGDLQSWIDRYVLKIKQGKDSSEVKLYCQQIMKKIIRTGFSIVMTEENSWTGDLEVSYDLFCKHYPEKIESMKLALDLIEKPISDKDKLVSILKEFSWLILEINNKLKH